MSLWDRQLTVTQNEDFTISLGYASLAKGIGVQVTSATPITFAGASAILTVNETSDETSSQILRLTSSAGGGITFSTGTVQGVSCGQIVVTLTHTQTAALAAGTFYFDLVVAQGGINEFYAAGPFIVVPTVSR